MVKISGLSAIDADVHLWYVDEIEKRKNQTIIILTIKEGRVTQDEQERIVSAICNIGYDFMSIWNKNIRFEKAVIIKEKNHLKRLDIIKKTVKEEYLTICFVLRSL